ncbi:hypothetical protein VL15_38145 [Burkholderia cepacia]|uniref:Protein kinase domain-containing protein n=2 Tax=Burkholderia cepacia TaxID=292 RepID=A0A0J5VXX5_BURCE|nr:hypothetical protein VL15_38145 [Burkholderia cepacia]
MMSGDQKISTHMGLWDKFKDLFRVEKKQDALDRLFKLMNVESPLNAFHSFNLLAQLATASNRTLFTTVTTQNQDNCHVSFCIDGVVVRAMQVSAQEKSLILLDLGESTDASYVQTQASSLEDYQLYVTPENLALLVDSDFAFGGVHKRFNADTGVLQAQDDVGCADFEREKQVAEYTCNREHLQRYVSTQQPIAAPRNVNPNFAYAKVIRYDPKHIVSHELDASLATLSPDQARSVAAQLVDMVRAFYCNRLSHRDLHMQNLLVHKREEDGSVFLKAIDFGRARFDQDFEAERFNDIDYLFDRKGCSLAETVGRNFLVGKDSEVARKHYPLHKLLERFNVREADVVGILSRIGRALKEDLQSMGFDDEQGINQAFECALESVQGNLAKLIASWEFE